MSLGFSVMRRYLGILILLVLLLRAVTGIIMYYYYLEVIAVSSLINPSLLALAHTYLDTGKRSLGQKDFG